MVSVANNLSNPHLHSLHNCQTDCSPSVSIDVFCEVDAWHCLHSFCMTGYIKCLIGSNMIIIPARLIRYFSLSLPFPSTLRALLFSLCDILSQGWYPGRFGLVPKFDTYILPLPLTISLFGSYDLCCSYLYRQIQVSFRDTVWTARLGTT